ncbi:uncharacterized protein LOC125045729 [Penaeus chinensis]|uniref:uncharacterized protein LOC125045729 n=1 Tax=Penaeus chinensis TaxID=139456 RepID=UPI001FB6FE1C|nr:uncharacterized protein LOC125045729 [Penaeus chinensis]
MSSSSDSEDDERFRAICDPTLSANYSKNDTLADLNGGVQPQGKEEKVEIEDDRPSFLLLKRIQRCTAADGAQIVRGHGLRASEKVRCSSNARSNRKGEADLPSSISKYLGKQLTGILDKNIVVSAGDVTARELSIQPQNQNGCSFQFVKDIEIENSLQASENAPETSSANKKRKSMKYQCKTSYDEKQIAAQCQAVAVTPEWILSRSGDYPWPHPKNIRYLEKYQVKERRANGVIVAVPLDEAPRSMNACNGNSTTLNALNPPKKKIKDAIPEDQGNGSTEDKGGLKSTPNSILINGEDDNTKKRKQGRKRGKKSKCTKKTNECNDTPT